MVDHTAERLWYCRSNNAHNHLSPEGIWYNKFNFCGYLILSEEKDFIVT